MTQSESQILAVGCLGLASLTLILAIIGQRRAAGIANSVLALVFLGFTLPDAGQILLRPNHYVYNYGHAALANLPLDLTVGGFAFVAFIFSIVAVRWRPAFVWFAWIINLPTVALVVYLAFFFRIF